MLFNQLLSFGVDFRNIQKNLAAHRNRIFENAEKRFSQFGGIGEKRAYLESCAARPDKAIAGENSISPYTEGPASFAADPVSEKICPVIREKSPVISDNLLKPEFPV
jgi:hypothetical protein